jgi:hypothetical protein
VLAGPRQINAGRGVGGKLGVEPVSVCNRARLPQSVLYYCRPEHGAFIIVSNKLHILFESSNVQRLS